MAKGADYQRKATAGEKAALKKKANGGANGEYEPKVAPMRAEEFDDEIPGFKETLDLCGREYRDVVAEIKKLEERRRELSEVIMDLIREAHWDSIIGDGYEVVRVDASRTTLSEIKLVESGVGMDVIEQCRVKMEYDYVQVRAYELNDLLALSIVPRWTIVPMYRQQSVAEHSFRATVIFIELCVRSGTIPTAQDIRLVLEHDGPESHSGDIPTPFENLLTDCMESAEDAMCPWYCDPRDRFSTDEVCNCFDAADLIEQYTWLQSWGNGPVSKRVLSYVYNRLKSLALDRSTVFSIIADILDEEGRYGGRKEASR